VANGPGQMRTPFVSVGTGQQKARWAHTFNTREDTNSQRQGRMESIRTAFVKYDISRNTSLRDNTQEISLLPQGSRCPRGTD
jgi:hypothetical protein